MQDACGGMQRVCDWACRPRAPPLLISGLRNWTEKLLLCGPGLLVTMLWDQPCRFRRNHCSYVWKQTCSLGSQADAGNLCAKKVPLFSLGCSKRAPCVHPLMLRENCLYRVRKPVLVHACTWVAQGRTGVFGKRAAQCQTRAGAVVLK